MPSRCARSRRGPRRGGLRRPSAPVTSRTLAEVLRDGDAFPLSGGLDERCVAPVSYIDAVTTRHDVSMVEPQGGYIAKRCPVRVQNDVLGPAKPSPPSEVAALRMQQGVAFEADVFAELADALRGDTSVVFLAAGLSSDAAIAATVEAMAAGIDVIAGGWLPVDKAGRRTGKPDLLVRHGSGYLPVDVKHHLTLQPTEDDDLAAVSELSAPFFESRRSADRQARRKHKPDALQLAHYRRMLEAAGFAASANWAGIVGKERLVVWYDLDEPLWSTPAKSDGKKRKTRTSMEVYDFEFGFRLDIAAIASQARNDPQVGLLVDPVACPECVDCPWEDYCAATLNSGSGDPSLLPGVSYRAWRTLRDHGITDRRTVAALDLETAQVGADGVPTLGLLETAEAVDPATTLAELLSGSKKQLAALTEHGFETAGDVVARIHAATAALGPVSFLPRAIISARAAVGPAPAYRLPGCDGRHLPRGDIEIDVDMENTNNGVYLWGAYVTDRAGTGLVTPGYTPFVSWDPLDAAGELALFQDFWCWLAGIRGNAAAAGVTVRTFCWYEMAEKTQMLRIAAGDPGLEPLVADFVDSPEWVDLYEVFRGSWTTGESSGLKAIAPLAGHEWSVDDPGGAISMVRYEEATDAAVSPEERDATRRWLLDYNRGDVVATLRIRDWLDDVGSDLPQVST